MKESNPDPVAGTKADRIERLVKRLMKLAVKYKLRIDPEFGEACLVFAATALEGHLDAHGFLERARAWWDLTVATHPTDPEKRLGPSLGVMEQAAREMAETVRVQSPAGAGFALVVFNFGPKGEVTYISTGDRNDTIGMLGSLVQLLKQEREKPNAAGVRPS